MDTLAPNGMSTRDDGSWAAGVGSEIRRKMTARFGRRRVGFLRPLRARVPCQAQLFVFGLNPAVRPIRDFSWIHTASTAHSHGASVGRRRTRLHLAPSLLPSSFHLTCSRPSSSFIHSLSAHRPHITTPVAHTAGVHEPSRLSACLSTKSTTTVDQSWLQQSSASPTPPWLLDRLRPPDIAACFSRPSGQQSTTTHRGPRLDSICQPFPERTSSASHLRGLKSSPRSGSRTALRPCSRITNIGASIPSRTAVHRHVCHSTSPRWYIHSANGRRHGRTASCQQVGHRLGRPSQPSACALLRCWRSAQPHHPRRPSSWQASPRKALRTARGLSSLSLPRFKRRPGSSSTHRQQRRCRPLHRRLGRSPLLSVQKLRHLGRLRLIAHPPAGFVLQVERLEESVVTSRHSSKLAANLPHSATQGRNSAFNSLSAITGGSDLDEHDWEKMIHSSNALGDEHHQDPNASHTHLPWSSSLFSQAPSSHPASPTARSELFLDTRPHNGTTATADSFDPASATADPCRRTRIHRLCAPSPVAQPPFRSHRRPPSRHPLVRPDQPLCWRCRRCARPLRPGLQPRTSHRKPVRGKQPGHAHFVLQGPRGTTPLRIPSDLPSRFAASFPAHNLDGTHSRMQSGLDAPSSSSLLEIGDTLSNLDLTGSSPARAGEDLFDIPPSNAASASHLAHGHAMQPSLSTYSNDADARPANAKRLPQLVTTREALQGAHRAAPNNSLPPGPLSASAFVPPIGHAHSRNQSNDPNGSHAPIFDPVSSRLGPLHRSAHRHLARQRCHRRSQRRWARRCSNARLASMADAGVRSTLRVHGNGH
ncbi:hypothetical protein L1887_63077 [Cichorium endivia]|nr:hypothetical protein L1887_63077 [Cichorium endivia]